MADFKYKKAAAQIRELITNGTYRVGQRIPTEVELCESLAIGRQTLRKAVSMLEEEGQLRRVQGSGTYVCGQEEAPAAEAAAFPVIHSTTITLLMMNSNSYIFLSIMQGISEELGRHGYLLNTMMTDGDYEQERMILKNLLANPPAALIVEPTHAGNLSVNRDLYKEVFCQIPCVLIHADAMEGAPALQLRDREGVKKAADYLISLGHRRLGSIFVFDEMTGQNRYRGYLDALSEHKIRHEGMDSIWLESNKKTDIFEEKGSLALDRMLENVTAVLCHDDRVAGHLVWYLKRKGIRVPEDISVIGYDDSEYARADLPLTTVTHPQAEYGRRAAMAALDLIRTGGQADISVYSEEPQLVIRESTAEVKENQG